jgi:hypothetical protein
MENIKELFLYHEKFSTGIHKVINKGSKIKTFGTVVPVCPWCGEKYHNYQDFSHKEIITLCCKKDCDKEFRVIRIDSKKGVIYNTVKSVENSRKE